MADYSMDSDHPDTQEESPENLTALQKRIYETAEDRYRSKHFAPVSVDVVPTTPDHYDPVKGILLRAYELVAPDLYSDGYDLKLTDLEGRAATTSIFTALVNGHVAGSVTLVQDPESDLHLFGDASAAYLRFLAVDPSAHRVGIGRQLVEHCLTHAADLKHRAVGLHTSPAMTSAVALYTSMGFARSHANDGVPGYTGEAPAYIKVLT